uniref:Glycosylated integral membrane protein 1 n=1 Tax=Canis lupus familiaris TaxID=9615 RepID=A0A8I3P6M8_CANLF
MTKSDPPRLDSAPTFGGDAHAQPAFPGAERSLPLAPSRARPAPSPGAPPPAGLAPPPPRPRPHGGLGPRLPAVRRRRPVQDGGLSAGAVCPPAAPARGAPGRRVADDGYPRAATAIPGPEVKNENLENSEEKEYFGIVSVRVLVHEWPMTSGSSLQLIVIQEEVVEIDGKQAQQKDVTEIDILVKNQGILRHSNYTLPLEESMLYSISRDSDILFTLPNLSKKVESVSSLQTTSQYPIRNVETTVDEDALPGKLPETPLRAEPPSSYKVMCQWMEKFRKDLCRFWSSVFPVFFMFLNVMVVGIIGAAVVITILKVLFPVCEYKGILQLDKANAIPVTAIHLFPDNPEKKAETLEDKTCV